MSGYKEEMCLPAPPWDIRDGELSGFNYAKDLFLGSYLERDRIWQYALVYCPPPTHNRIAVCYQWLLYVLLSDISNLFVLVHVSGVLVVFLKWCTAYTGEGGWCRPKNICLQKNMVAAVGLAVPRIYLYKWFMLYIAKLLLFLGSI